MQRTEASAPSESQAIPSNSQGQANVSLPVGDAYGFYGILKLDAASRSPSAALSQAALMFIDKLNSEFRPQPSAFLGWKIIASVASVVATLVALMFITHGHPDQIGGVGVVFVLITFSCITGIVYFYIRARIRNTIYKFEQGRLQIDSCFIWRFRKTLELYRLTHIHLHQSFLNRKTDDGTLWLVFDSVVFHVPFVIRLKGLAKINDMERIMNDLRQLALVLRMHPLVKGIVR